MAEILSGATVSWALSSAMAAVNRASATGMSFFTAIMNFRASSGWSANLPSPYISTASAV